MCFTCYIIYILCENEAQKFKENAEKKLKEYNKIIDDAKNEAKKIISENKKKLDN